MEEASVRRGAEAAAAPADLGIYVQFQAPAGVDLKLESLENKHAGIEVRGVQRNACHCRRSVRREATVFFKGKVGHFLTRFQQYTTEDTETGKPKNREFVDRIAAIQLATLRALWTDDAAEFPPDEALTWWEVAPARPCSLRR